jgi:general secretion pathway protein D
VALGGLSVESETEARSQVPILGDIPILGALFQSTHKGTTKTRFFVFIRASVLRAPQFEDLKYLSDREALAAGVDTGWPELEPRVIR